MLAYVMEKIKPIFDRVLMKREVEQQSESGIIIPKSFDDKSVIFRIVEVGEVAHVKVGERVIVAKYAGTDVRVASEVYTIVCENDILGVFHE